MTLGKLRAATHGLIQYKLNQGPLFITVCLPYGDDEKFEKLESLITIFRMQNSVLQIN
jgi:hypothetical protein